MLRQLLESWTRLSVMLDDADIAHADLQHGNVILVPRDQGKFALKIIDYDGMYVPAMPGTPKSTTLFQQTRFARMYWSEPSSAPGARPSRY